MVKRLDKFLLTKSYSVTTNVMQKRNFKGLKVGQLEIENSRIIVQNDTLNELESAVNVAARKIYIPEKSGRIELTDVRFTLEESSV